MFLKLKGLIGSIRRDNFYLNAENKLFKVQVCVDQHGLVAKFRKLHAFINPHVSQGNEYCVFELHGWKCGIPICYDNNMILALMGISLHYSGKSFSLKLNPAILLIFNLYE